MKKLILSLLLLLPVMVMAQPTDGIRIGDLYYVLDDSAKTARVTYEAYPDVRNYVALTTVRVPGEVSYDNRSYAVTEIGANAFAWSPVRKVMIAEGITAIGEHAFEGCTGLESVKCPNSLTQIGEKAFHYCINLSSVKIPSHLKIARLSVQSVESAEQQLNMADYRHIAEQERQKLRSELNAVDGTVSDINSKQSFALPRSSDFKDEILVNLLRSAILETRYGK